MFGKERIRKRKLLTLQKKVDIINMFENGEKVNQISKNLNLSNSTVSSIIKDKKRIIAASKTEAFLDSSTIIRKRHGIIAQTECALKSWCEEKAGHSLHLSQNDICTQAKIIYEELKRDYGEAAKNNSFSASKGWYLRFKRRCVSNMLTEFQEEENQEGDSDRAEATSKKDRKEANKGRNIKISVESTFSDYLKTIVEKGLYTPQTIFNVDEVGLYWKKMPENSHLKGQGQTVSEFSESKDRLTMLLGGNAAGDLKLKPLVVYRKENPKALQKKHKCGLPVIWKSNPTASMSAFLFEDWFGNYFIPEVERYSYANNIACKVLLVIDSANCHSPATLIDFDHRVRVVFLPHGDASISQPIQEISNKFKTIYTRHVFEYLVGTSRQNHNITAEDLWKEFNILDAIRLIVDSCTDINKNDWKQSWKTLFPFLYNETELGTEFNSISEIIEEIISLALDLDMKVNRKDITNLLDSHNKDPTIEELIEMQEFSTNEELDVQDPLPLDAPMNIENLTEALSHIKIGLQILGNIDVNEQRARKTRLGVLKLVSEYEEILSGNIKSMARHDESGDVSSTYNNEINQCHKFFGF
ncbi:unnamed protein product [Arctia plantaginis]|uniref:HTH CENPB-type domain-containing protein n=1 Tax=Arctia plantaginis TaxID=874455 RepID=A0A8S0ZAT0_ARCPL|nr:unnamed protein product [Arctia plantaginis]